MPAQTLRARIQALLADSAPLTAMEIAEQLDTVLIQARHLLYDMKARGEVHVVDWQREALGVKAYPRPVYAAGPGVNKRRPPAQSKADAMRQYRRRRSGLTRKNFVFNLGKR